MVKSNKQQPMFVNQKTAQKAPIVFDRVGRKISGSNKAHTLQDLHSMEDQLTRHFRHIGLVGTFVIAFASQEMGANHYKGLTVMKVLQNKIYVAYQPNGGDSRFSYTISFPPHLASSAFEKLTASVKEGLSVVAQPAQVATTPLEQVTAPISAEAKVVSRDTEVLAGADLMLLRFEPCVSESVISTLSAALTAELQRFPYEGIFKVKCANKVGGPALSGTSAIVWCNLQPKASGLGFWFRPNETSDWAKYALVAESADDIAGLADKLGKIPEVAVMNPVFSGHSVIPTKIGVADYKDDIEVTRNFVNALASRMKKEGLLHAPSGLMTEVFSSNVDDSLVSMQVGRLMGEWAGAGYLWRKKPSPKASYYVYGIGLKAVELLPEDLLHMAGTSIRPCSFQTKSIEPPVHVQAQQKEQEMPVTLAEKTIDTEPVESQDPLLQMASIFIKLQSAVEKIRLLEAALSESRQMVSDLQKDRDDLADELKKARSANRDDMMADIMAKVAAINI